MATKAIVGEKVGMTQVWGEDNRVVPVTVVKVAPLRVVQVKTTERDGYSALQVTFGQKKSTKLTKPVAGQYEKAGVESGEKLVELRLDDVSEFTVGQELAADLLAAGERVDVTAVSKGKGFAGVMKRHNFKGQRMAGRMGGEKVTTLNLKVVSADAERNLLLVQGAVPGPKGGLVLVRTSAKGK